MKLRNFLAAILLAFAALPAFPQSVAIKTNLLSDVLLCPDLGVEVGLSKKWSLDLTGHGVAWNNGDKRFRHWQLLPEARLWLCQRFHGHFFALHGIVGQFNLGNIGSNIRLLGLKDLKDKRYEGWMYGAGIGYGYDWLLSKHWNLEAEIGAGWIRSKSDVYPCGKCGTVLEKGQMNNYFGLTKLSLAIEYLF